MRFVVAAFVGALLVVCASSPAMAARTTATPSTATPSTGGSKAPTRAACEAFADYFQIEFLVAFASAFADIGDGKKAKETATEIRDTFHLILSPKLEQVTRTLADGTDPALRKLFVRQAKGFGRGVALLEDVGLTKGQIQTLSELDLKPQTDLQQVVGDVDLDKQELKRAVKRFGSSAKSIDLNQATSKEQRAFADAGSACGVFPVDVSCSKVVTTDEATGLLGGLVTTTSKDGTCTYTGPADKSQDAAELAVDVYQSSLTFDRITESVQNQSVPGVGDAAVALDGFNSFSSVKSCGRTLVAKQGERTVVVAACTGDTRPSAEALAGIATNVLARSGQT
jgi:hypothetical protein